MFSDELKKISWEETTERIARMTTRYAPYLLFPHRWLAQKPPDLSFCRSAASGDIR